jgi:hypothetical protein
MTSCGGKLPVKGSADTPIVVEDATHAIDLGGAPARLAADDGPPGKAYPVLDNLGT